MYDAPLLNTDDLRGITRWAADCAERALPVSEAKAPDDDRPREAIAAARAFAESGVRTAHLRTVAWAALAAAREASDPAVAAAARAASAAAGAAYTHPIATPHQGKHIVAPAAYAALALGLAASDPSGAQASAVRWAIEQAPIEARQVLQRMPGQPVSKALLDKLMHQLDAALRG